MKSKKESGKRVATYLPLSVFKWLSDTANKIGLSESAYIRYLVMREKDDKK